MVGLTDKANERLVMRYHHLKRPLGEVEGKSGPEEEGAEATAGGKRPGGRGPGEERRSIQLEHAGPARDPGPPWPESSQSRTWSTSCGSPWPPRRPQWPRTRCWWSSPSRTLTAAADTRSSVLPATPSQLVGSHCSLWTKREGEACGYSRLVDVSSSVILFLILFFVSFEWKDSFTLDFRRFSTLPSIDFFLSNRILNLSYF